MTNEQETRWQKERAEFERLHTACMATGDDNLTNAIINARTNADCTFQNGEMNPDYYRVALGSIAETGLSDAAAAWFKQQGHQI